MPQGSILGPLLFLIYINDLFLSVRSSNALSFADDTKCYKQILEHLDSIQLQQDLDSMANWSRDWNQFFNTSKFIHLSFNTKFPTSYFIDDTIIKTSSTHHESMTSVSFYQLIYLGKIIITIYQLKPIIEPLDY